ncbi:MAG TPA: acetate--CoA ligase family protein, partial [Acidimicrobiales bacterium]|nr:acetate--CoA ligase family protein [Acidimicrobiales bacterium]
VLKVDDAAIPHKAKVGCIALGLHDAAAVIAAFESVVANARRVAGAGSVRAVVVERQAREGIDLFAGVIRRDGLDPVLVAGLGGVAVEAGLALGAARLPVDVPTAQRLLQAAGLDKVVATAGGAAGAAQSAVAQVLERLAELSIALGPSLRALDANPLRVLPSPPLADGSAGPLVIALDALVELSGEDA